MINCNIPVDSAENRLSKDISSITFLSSDDKCIYLRYISAEDNYEHYIVIDLNKWKFLTLYLDNHDKYKVFDYKNELERNIMYSLLKETTLKEYYSLSEEEKAKYFDLLGSNSIKFYRDVFLRKKLFTNTVLEPFENKIVWFLDIEVYRNKEYTNPQADNEKHFVNSVSIYDNNGILYNFLLVKEEFHNLSEVENIIEEVKEYFMKNYGVKVNIEVFRSERDLFNEMRYFLLNKVPHVITGWNVFFDINFLIKRGEFLDTKIFDKYIKQSSFNAGMTIDWYLPIPYNAIDYLLIYKNYNREKPESFNLDSVAEFELGINKVEYSESLDILYEKDLKTFLIYNITDTYLVKLLDDKLTLIDFVYKLSEISLVPVIQLNFKNISKVVDGIIYRYTKENMDNEIIWIRNDFVKKSKDENKDDDEVAYRGAFVKQPEKAGVYYFVSDLDATSLYPSIIESFNISMDSFLFHILSVEGFTDNIELMKYLKDESRTDKDGAKVIISFESENDTYELTLKEMKKILKKFCNYEFTITNTMNVFGLNYNSIYKKIMKDLKVKRKEYKNKMIKLIKIKEILNMEVQEW